MEIVYVYSKQRKEFGRAAKFVDLHADTLAETVPNPDQVRMQPLPFRSLFFSVFTVILLSSNLLSPHCTARRIMCIYAFKAHLDDGFAF
jgi:hypothetical protein